jgi:hypothetical protein
VPTVAVGRVACSIEGRPELAHFPAVSIRMTRSDLTSSTETCCEGRCDHELNKNISHTNVLVISFVLSITTLDVSSGVC